MITKKTMSTQQSSQRLGTGSVVFVIAVMTLGLLSTAHGAPLKNPRSYTVSVVVAPRYDVILSFVDGFAPMRSGKRWGMLDEHGKELVSPRYDYVDFFSNGLAAVKQGRKWGFIDRTGREVVPLKYDIVGKLAEGRIRVSQGSLYGYLDAAGRVVIPMKYSFVGQFYGGLATFSRGGKYGILDLTGKEVVSPISTSILQTDPGFQVIWAGNRCGYIDRSTGRTHPALWSFCKAFTDGLGAVGNFEKEPDEKLVRRYGFIDVNGKVVVPLRYDDVAPFREGRATVKRGNRWGFIDRTGKEIVPPRYDEIKRFSSGLVAVRKGRLWGYVNLAGREVMKPQLEYGGEHRKGFALAKLKGLYGILDAKARYRVPARYVGLDWSPSCLLSPFAVQDASGGTRRFGYLDVRGRVVIVPKYDFAHPFDNGLARVVVGGKVGYIDSAGGAVVPPDRYDSLTFFKGGLGIMKEGGKYGVLRLLPPDTT